jgi:hypothetical protein
MGMLVLISDTIGQSDGKVWTVMCEPRNRCKGVWEVDLSCFDELGRERKRVIPVTRLVRYAEK